MQTLNSKKSNFLDTVRGRIIHFSDNQEVSRAIFMQKTGLKKGIFDYKDIDRAVGSDKISNILDSYSELNPTWLLTGEGEMLRTSGELVKSEEHGQGIPLITVDAIAGWGKGETQVMDYDTERYVVPEFTRMKVDFMINVRGDSMVPHYNSGDIVACKKLTLDSFFQWNKIYVLDTDQGAMIKRVRKSAKEGYIECVSENSAYTPFDLSLTDDINALALVVGVIRFE